ncbi:myb protein [Anaeramoeba flamelloides]|uniref:Myb protein n=1 Tax=Anaeramoeba flamelloides TaxID=1746091 RepID=A0ABQ8YY77_9EUKA|nr:myb protein [Anaeramoeba flamelloides]
MNEMTNNNSVHKDQSSNNNLKNTSNSSHYIDTDLKTGCMRKRKQRSNVLTSNGIRKGSWEKYEDELLIEAVNKYETYSWTKIANLVPSRNAKQCRERWINQLNPDLVHGFWTNEEDEIILKMRGQLGNKWAQIQKKLSRRSANAIKNRYNSLATLAKKKKKKTPKNCQNQDQKNQFIDDQKTKNNNNNNNNNNNLLTTTDTLIDNKNASQLDQELEIILNSPNNSQLMSCPSPNFTECFRSPKRRKRKKKRIVVQTSLKARKLFQNGETIKKELKRKCEDLDQKSNLEILLLVAEHYF